MFFGTAFLCKCKPPILKEISTGEYVSVVQNRGVSASDTEILLESFSDAEDEEEESCNKMNDNDKQNSSDDIKDFEKLTLNDAKNHNDDAAEIRRLLRRKDELVRKQKMQERYNERLQVSY